MGGRFTPPHRFRSRKQVPLKSEMSKEMSEANPKSLSPSSRRRSIFEIIFGFVILWIVIASVIAPFAWDRYANHDLKLDTSPPITQTGDHHPGDPLNVV